MIKSTNQKEYVALITLLIKSRERQGLTIRELGDRLEVDNTLITKVENLRRTLALGEFLQYCDSLGEDPAKLIKKAKEMSNVG